MIKIGRILDASTDYDENWMVVRALKTVPPHAIHEPRLSPSRQLFYRYLDAKSEGRFNAEWFQQVYVRAFLRELFSDRANMELMDRLYRDSFTKNILLACFCADEALCHRSILAGLLAGVGARIECDAGYLKYYGMFQDMVYKRGALKNPTGT